MRELRHWIGALLLLAMVATAGSLLGTGCATTDGNGEGTDGGSSTDDGATDTDGPDDTPPPTRERYQQADNFEQAKDAFMTELAAQMEGRDIKVLRLDPLLVPTREQVLASIDAGVGLDWLKRRIATGHRNDYILGNGRRIRAGIEQKVTSSPLFGEVRVEDTLREELLQMIIQSQDVTYDPDTMQQLGNFQGAQAMLVTRLTAEFEALGSTGPFIQYSWWVRGNYRLEARLIDTERATSIWYMPLEWERVWIVSAN